MEPKTSMKTRFVFQKTILNNNTKVLSICQITHDSKLYIQYMYPLYVSFITMGISYLQEIKKIDQIEFMAGPKV